MGHPFKGSFFGALQLFGAPSNAVAADAAMSSTFLEAAALRAADSLAPADRAITSTTNSLVALPHNLLEIVLSFLPLPNLAITSTCCHLFHDCLANAASMRARRLCLHVPARDPIDEPLLRPFFCEALSAP